MAKRKIAIGNEYGDLKITKDLGYTKSRHHYYLCLCRRCNKSIMMSKEKLIKTDTICCGECKKNSKYIGKIIKDYEVICKLYDDSNSDIKWECKCQKCGKTIEISERNLKDGRFPECPCKVFVKPAKSLLNKLF